jgi:hypothetical protein
MEEHERTCKCEWFPVWQVTVRLDNDSLPMFRTKKQNFSVRGKKE